MVPYARAEEGARPEAAPRRREDVHGGHRPPEYGSPVRFLSRPVVEYLAAAAVMAVLVVVFFNPFFRSRGSLSAVSAYQNLTYPWVPKGGPPIFVQHDQAVFVYPRQVFLRDSLKDAGQLPLWDPLTFSGHPFFAQTGSRLAYPPMLVLSAVFSPIAAHDTYLMLHLFMAGLSAFAVMKQFRARFGAALLTGVAWAFSSYGMLYYILEMYAAVAALLPLAVLLVRRWHDEDSWVSLLLGGLTLGVLYLGTSAELALMSCLFVGAYAGALAVSTLRAEWSELTPRRRAAVLAAPVALALSFVAVAAVGIFPFLRLSGLAERMTIPYDELVDFFGRSRLADLQFLFRPPATPLSGLRALPQEVFLGTAVGVLALVGLTRRRPGMGMAAGVALFLALFNLGTPLTRFLYQFPGFESLHGFSRSLFLFNFGVAVLGGLGLDRLLALRRPPPPAAGLVALVVVAVTFVQLFQYGRGVNLPFQRRDASQLFPPTIATEAARGVIGTGPGRGRLLPLIRAGVDINVSRVLPAATNMALDLPVPIGYEPVLPDTTAMVERAMGGEPFESIRSTKLKDSAFRAEIMSNGVRVDILGRSGVAAVLAPPGMTQDPGWDAAGAARRGLQLTYAGDDGTVYTVAGVLPRATVVTGERWTPSDDTALAAFMDPTFDARREVILHGKGAGAPSGVATGAVPDAQVDWKDDRPNTLRMSVTSARPGWLLVLDSWDPGWRAEVDGRRVTVERANVGFRAVRVPAGTSDVKFFYAPTELLAGAWLSATSASSVVIFAVVAWIRRRRSGVA